MRRQSDLVPPLGTRAGPCRVVERILESGLPPAQKSTLVDRVEHDVPLENAQTVTVYSALPEKGVTPFNSILLTPHVQYRMDLRGVTMRDLRESLARFVAQVMGWQRDPRKYREELAQLSKAKFDWEDPKTHLQLVFAAGRTALNIVTMYWKGTEDPKAPPGGCPLSRTAYRAPVTEWAGARTFVNERSTRGISTPATESRQPGESPRSDAHRALPQAPDSKENLEQHPPGGSYTTPSTPPPRTPVRSPGTPGEQYGHPYKTNPAQRRTGNFYIEKFPRPGGLPGLPSPTNPVNPYPDIRHDHSPGDLLDLGQVTRNPGTGKKSPVSASAVRVAARLEEILSGLDSGIRHQGEQLRPELQRQHSTHSQFSVKGAHGQTYRVALQWGELREPWPRQDLRVSCTCDFWRWQGPEHWARVGRYLAGTPRGTAARPGQKDPQGTHRVCKHVAAVLSRLEQWPAPDSELR